MTNEVTAELSAKGYWPAVAYEYLTAGEYSRAVELCTIRLKEYADSVSGRIILARALYHSGQVAEAEEEFYAVLRRDSDNLVALKYLGDIKYANGDETTAMSYYHKILQIEPRTTGLACEVGKSPTETTHILKLKRGEEISPGIRERLRELPFHTETAGDLLQAQGHYRLALAVYKELAERVGHPRLQEKINELEMMLKNGRNTRVQRTD
ncbi:MAG: tetratricopeptide repeat protein [candidate division Zixibacteria bacterium]|nr:tetratricopeptide repeat protein [candidate division Zixibacteria bacterium]